MIQFRRGSTKNWRATKVKLAAGQPGYDKDKHKIKIGDGESSWASLPYASGLTAEEILNSESAASSRFNKDKEDKTLITYGEEPPTVNTVGQLYLQQYSTEPETDYIITSGVDGIWAYQVWKSGIARCYGMLSLATDVQAGFDGVGLYYDGNKMTRIDYPITFNNVPCETATVQSPGGIVWLANRAKNTKNGSGIYNIISPDRQSTSAVYSISLSVEGFIEE